MEPETSPTEVLIEEEPRYLRRQKPLEVKRRRFGKRAFSLPKRIAIIGATLALGGWALYATARFLLDSPRVALLHPEQIQLTGNRFVARSAVLQIFRQDRNRSILRIPLDERRRALELIPWVERAVVRRALPNRLQVELAERTPVAFLRSGANLQLVDVRGVILERPLEGDFRFPVVTGISESMPLVGRERRMNRFVEFMKQVDLARPRSGERVSEVDLADAGDLRATLAGLPELAGQGPVLVHFGDGDFLAKFRLLLDDFAQWRASAGRVDSVDLRFSREVVVNPGGAALGALQK
jgi:cell division protein FtsQ